MECPKCCFSEIDRMVRYSQDLGTFNIKLGCPRCKAIWAGVLSEENNDESIERANHYAALQSQGADS